VTLIAEAIKDYLVPGSTWFLIIAGSLGAACLFGAERLRRTGRAFLAALFLLYWTMSVPLVALGLQKIKSPDDLTVPGLLPSEPYPIVVLGNGLGGYFALGGRVDVPGGRTAMNTLFALHRYRRHPTSTLIASGGRQPGTPDGVPEAAIIGDALRRNGVPDEHILLETASSTTKEQADATSLMLKARGERTCILVTSPQQMSRAIDLFRRNGIAAIPLAAGSLMWAPAETRHWWSWLFPTTEARAVSRDVIYEMMAWPYYRARGWVS
jgi:uncharacterized SAM-binding protein YcdF (DUF218 family)